MGLTHPLIAGGGGRGQAIKAIGSKVVGGIAPVVKEVAVASIAGLVVSAAANAADRIGSNSFSSWIRDGSGGEMITDVVSMTTDQLINSLYVVDEETVTNPLSMTMDSFAIVQQAAQGGQRVMDELYDRALSDPEEAARIENGFAMKGEATTQEMGSADSFVNTASDSDLALAEDVGSDGLIDPSTLNDRNRGRDAFGRGPDGKRVSREYHEYQFCRTSGQIATVLQFMRRWDNEAYRFPDQVEFRWHEASGEEIGADINPPSIDSNAITYGQFVDMPCLRKFIALYRKIRSKVFAKNVKCLIDLLPQEIDQGVFVLEIFSQFDFTPLIQEFDRTFNSSIRYRSNQIAKDGLVVDDGGTGLSGGTPGEQNLPDDPIEDAVAVEEVVVVTAAGIAQYLLDEGYATEGLQETINGFGQTLTVDAAGSVEQSSLTAGFELLAEEGFLDDGINVAELVAEVIGAWSAL